MRLRVNRWRHEFAKKSFVKKSRLRPPAYRRGLCPELPEAPMQRDGKRRR